jgi:AcrR family transcriptional regulator
VPKLWDKTIEAHRRGVREAILDTTAALAIERGPLSVTMSQIAEETGVGRATLYKYFADVESILVAWHERQVHGHLAQLAEIHGRTGDPASRLAAVLEFYALMQHEHHDADLVALVHRTDHVTEAHQQLTLFIRELLVEAAATGAVRSDIAADELARYCLHAAGAAAAMPSKAAVRRLVKVVLAGLRPENVDR